MKRYLCVLLVAVALASPSLLAQQYAIDWFTIDDGGGTSTGGVYSLSGTIGQFDAGRMTGASDALDGGFWGFVGTIQTPGAPLLNVERIGSPLYPDRWFKVGGNRQPKKNLAAGFHRPPVNNSVPAGRLA